MPFHTCMDMNDQEGTHVSFKNMFKKVVEIQTYSRNPCDLLLWKLVSKDSKVRLRNHYLATFEYFRCGILLLISQSKRSKSSPAPGLLTDSPGNEVALPCTQNGIVTNNILDEIIVLFKDHPSVKNIKSNISNGVGKFLFNRQQQKVLRESLTNLKQKLQLVSIVFLQSLSMEESKSPFLNFFH